VQTAGCHGIEFGSAGRCEIWTRADGIGSSVAISGFTCMRYHLQGIGPSTTVASGSGEFMPVDGGVNRACRGYDAADNSGSYYSLFTKPSLEDCQELCVQTAGCQGIEFGSTGRCEIWTRAEGIGATVAFAGYTCLGYQSGGSISSTMTLTTTSTEPCHGEIRWAAYPGKCFNVADGGTVPGTSVQLWDCGSYDSNGKFLIPEGGSGQIRWASHPDLCLAVAGGSHEDGTNIQLEDCDRSSTSQMFQVLGDNASHSIRWTENSNKCLDVKDGSSSNGANLQIWWCLPAGWEHYYNQQFLAANSGSCESFSTTTTTVPLTESTSTTTSSANVSACCFDFGQWPDVDGVTCSECTALVSTAAYGGRCDRYCETFGHMCVGAAEEVEENCKVKYAVRCDQAIQDTSDMLCSCKLPEAPESCPSPAPSPSATLIWSDEFDGDGPVDSSKWGYDTGGGGWGNNELQFYTDRLDNARREGGILKVIAKCEDYGGKAYTSARLVSKNRGDWGPGHRIEVRAKIPTGRGTWPAIWMLPTDWVYGGWPDSGEIDIMEHVGCNTGAVVGTVHTGAFNHMKHTEKGNTIWPEDITAWHTYTTEWEDTIIHWYLDNLHYHSFTGNLDDPAEWPFNQRFHLLLNIAVGGNWGGYCLNGSPSCSSWEDFRAEQVMEVDYVRVYTL